MTRRLQPFTVAIMSAALCLGLQPLSVAADSSEAMRSITAALRAGHYQQALDLARAAERSSPNDVRIFVLEGIALTRLGKDSEALRALKNAIALSPDYVPALEAAAEIEYRYGMPEAAAHLQRLLKLKPGEPTAHAMLGALAWRKSDCVSAVQHFEQAKVVIDRQPEALREFGACLLKLKRADEAAAVFRGLTALEPQDRRVLHSLAVALMDAGQFREAIAALEPLAKATPSDPVALELTSSAYESLGETPQAVALLRQAILADPRNEDLYLDFANLSFVHQSFQVGIDVITSGLKMLPDSAPLYLARGILYVQLSDYSNADADFDKAEQLRPRNGLSSAARGLAQIQQNNLGQALVTVRSQLKTSPNDPFLHYVLAELLARQGAQPGSPEFQAAIESARAAVRLKPDFSLARDVLSRLYLEAGQPDRAIEQCRLALRDNPEDEMALYRLIRALQSSGRPEVAAEVKVLLKRFATLREELRKRDSETSKYRLVEEPSADRALPRQ
jgi:tetratricopeptide (TPR) repeat protein